MKNRNKLIIISLNLLGMVFLLTAACEPYSPYKAEAEAILEKIGEVKAEYNGTQTDLAPKLRQLDIRSIEILVEQIEKSGSEILELKKEWGALSPPKEFLEFHLLMESALLNFHNATQAQVTAFTVLLSTGAIDEYTANRSSKHLKASNDEFTEAKYLYRSLTD